MIGKYYKIINRDRNGYGVRIPSFTLERITENSLPKQDFEWPEFKEGYRRYSDIVNAKKLFTFKIVGELDKEYILEFDGGRKCLISKTRMCNFQEYKMDYLSKELFEI